ncbi:exodeoxyribonuclease VII large subunit [Dechloromonas sp. XY25]|uniref:Exodeoxyribonuclease 7 large subunit n=1 Tax=Dechloromonas hankyongensis TaxID=2908002 RepID=A0ABS9K7A5_9RHOO|nr:exodeoxyribonuclease VII large subunit [Dechloromonas hankyongensis]MCG2578960.1 exodeoxyribonuclease VII large subunit [Dechloromonas hankyongensis]
MPNPTPPPGNSVLSVSSLNRLVRDCLESTFPLTWVGGEISNLTYAASGHVYFSLKDSSAQVRCVMWRNRAQLLGWRLENGQKIEARALVSFYEPRGEFQLNIEAIRRAGQGDLFERFLKLKAQLEAEGLFAAEAKRPLPAFPRRVAIVSSLQAAALRDVLTTLHRRAPHLRISIYPAPVQGEGAGLKIAEALARAGTGDCDAIILCRGGGSIEDLWSFNEECVARAIRATKIPVVSGVGHETDFTIADFAADLRAPTPTAAAELVSRDRDGLLAHLERLDSQLQRRTARTLADHQQRLDWLSARLVHPAERLRQRQQDVAALGLQLQRAVHAKIDRSRLLAEALNQRQSGARPRPDRLGSLLEHARYRLDKQVEWRISEYSGKLNGLASSLKQLDPHAVLQRGYTLVIGPDGRAVRNANELTPGDTLNLSFARGAATARVEQVVATLEAD